MLKNIQRSLEDLLGKPYVAAVESAAVSVLGISVKEADALLREKVDFFPESFQARCRTLAEKVGTQVVPAFDGALEGAPTESFRRVTHKDAAPISGLGCVRIGQDGRAYLAAKSEHYHIPLGHNFPGYRLITKARQAGILNATHNNTRGYITRLMEQRIIADINGLGNDRDALSEVLASREPKVLNRLINLETGSLSVEAALKMMLARFYRLDKTFEKPEYEGKIPVFLVIADNDGGCEANYHGTTILAQTLRGMWPAFYRQAEESGLYRVVSVKRNDTQDFAQKIAACNTGLFRTAGFLHEIVLMNYGGICLTPDFLQEAYALCNAYHTPTLADEIQSCMWYEGLFLFRQYGIRPDFVIIGKGFPGGEYPASKVVTTYEMDSLNQFGALVTNGQEELASLAYLITMEFVRENGKAIASMGATIEEGLQALGKANPHKIERIEGKGHLSSIHFQSVKMADDFSRHVNAMGIDVSAQLYKANCPPAVLLKLPLLIDEAAFAFLLERFETALRMV